jgi:hypothetical protein
MGLGAAAGEWPVKGGGFGCGICRLELLLARAIASSLLK